MLFFFLLSFFFGRIWEASRSVLGGWGVGDLASQAAGLRWRCSWGAAVRAAEHRRWDSDGSLMCCCLPPPSHEPAVDSELPGSYREEKRRRGGGGVSCLSFCCDLSLACCYADITTLVGWYFYLWMSSCVFLMDVMEASIWAMCFTSLLHREHCFTKPAQIKMSQHHLGVW